ncbi:hypothetical protein CALVIDRAFT_532045 [Calocera viscosa TUFC12733]|uniref:Uncharacterized protein n=1 Tax=Calocera viscosa (strain TUFC12733) TaxID=1330018 RepID=A0A167FI04_CALVF|nr:hypothetical protein CALVIDRAFT_532045 [Calocera viscosa TUFC12733]
MDRTTPPPAYNSDSDVGMRSRSTSGSSHGDRPFGGISPGELMVVEALLSKAEEYMKDMRPDLLGEDEEEYLNKAVILPEGQPALGMRWGTFPDVVKKHIMESAREQVKGRLGQLMGTFVKDEEVKRVCIWALYMSFMSHLGKTSQREGDRSAPLHGDYESVHGSDVAPSSDYSFPNAASVSDRYSLVSGASATENNTPGTKKIVRFPEGQQWIRALEPEATTLLSNFYTSAGSALDLQFGSPGLRRHEALGAIVPAARYGETTPVPFEGGAVAVAGGAGTKGFAPPDALAGAFVLNMSVTSIAQYGYIREDRGGKIWRLSFKGDKILVPLKEESIQVLFLLQEQFGMATKEGR